MVQQLRCKSCDTALSRSIDLRDGEYPAGREWTDYELKPLTEPGHAIRSSQPMVLSEDETNGPPLQFAPQDWLNPNDLTGSVKDRPDGKGLDGCCGPSGHGGPNQVCRNCGATVGTLMADCWTDHVFVPEPDKTYWMEAT